MKRFFIILTAFVVVMLVLSCQKELPNSFDNLVVNQDYVSRIKEIQIESEKLIFEADEEAGELTKTFIFSNEDLSNYRIYSDAAWCSVSIETVRSTITISVNENITGEERKATITLSDNIDGVSSRTFTVTQKQNNVIKLIDGESATYEVGTEGGQVVIHLESNVDYTVRIQDADWISLSGGSDTRGLQKSQVILDVARNTTEQDRSAQVSFINEATGAIANILIKQQFDSYLSVLQTEYTIDELGGEINLYVQANISFDIYTVLEDTWVKKNGSREVTNDYTVLQKISIAPFTAKEPKRTSSISVENITHGKVVTIKITQTRNLYIKESSINIRSGESQKLTLHNANNERVLWKSNDERVARVDDDGIVTGISVGTAKITVSSADGIHSDEVIVTVGEPYNPNDYITSQWLTSFVTYDNVSVLNSLKCMVNNGGYFDLVVKKATLYCDDMEMSVMNYNATWAIGSNMEFQTDIPVEYEGWTVKENKHKYILVWEYTYGNESFTYRCKYPI